jgi:hypothetical protein
MGAIMFTVRLNLTFVHPTFTVINVGIIGFLIAASIVLFWPKARVEVVALVEHAKKLKSNIRPKNI